MISLYKIENTKKNDDSYVSAELRGLPTDQKLKEAILQM